MPMMLIIVIISIFSDLVSEPSTYATNTVNSIPPIDRGNDWDPPEKRQKENAYLISTKLESQQNASFALLFLL